VRLWSTGSTGETQTIWFNLAWTAYNLVMLGAVVATASETKQVRRSHRVPLSIRTRIQLPDGRELPCTTVDFSTGGMALRLDEPEPLEPGSRIGLVLSHRGREQAVPAVVRHDRDAEGFSIEFLPMNIEQERWLVATTFARADIWISQWGRHGGKPSSSRWVKCCTPVRGFQRLGQYIIDSARQGFRRGTTAEEEQA
jgi:cellulose synthase (UDP-forming)